MKFSKMVKHGLRSLLNYPPAIFERNRSIKFHFNSFHGFGKLDKAIDLLEKEDREDFRKFTEQNNSYNMGNMFICNSKKIIKRNNHPNQWTSMILIKYHCGINYYGELEQSVWDCTVIQWLLHIPYSYALQFYTSNYKIISFTITSCWFCLTHFLPCTIKQQMALGIFIIVERKCATILRH